MNRGTYRRVIAASMLAAGLMLAAPRSADARLLEPTQGVEEPRQELSFLERLWQAFESLWANQSVMITPD